MTGAAIIKEFKLVFRDLHSLLVLFAMPAAFIVIMSLAMQDEFAADKQGGPVVRYHIDSPDDKTARFTAFLGRSSFLSFIETGASTPQAALNAPSDDRPLAYLSVATGAFDASGGDGAVTVWLAPSVETRTRLLIEAAVNEAYAKTRLAQQFAAAGASEALVEEFIPAGAIRTEYLYSGAAPDVRPTSVQQNVPAWLIFSMFFVVIPISTTLITEKQFGTLDRIRTMPASMPAFIAAKIPPYLAINQVQLIIMLLVGIYIVPLLGGNRLGITGSTTGLAVMSLATGFAATGYGLFIAALVRTTEQATAVGGIGNILLGALGGIMVPKFVMPDYLQAATHVSPMAWGLEGFLDILLRGGGVDAIAFEALTLSLFGAVLLGAAIVIIQRRRS